MSMLVFWRKQFREDSGGPGTTRGGLGQHIEIGNSLDEAFTCGTAYERVDHPARGYDGGLPGAPGYVGLTSGTVLPGKGRHLVPKGERIVIKSPGGGGLGDPRARPLDLIQRDLENELISEESMRTTYGRP
jgi:N-methylhydantoinase B